MEVTLSDGQPVNIRLEVSEAREAIRRFEIVAFAADAAAVDDEQWDIGYLDSFFGDIEKVVGKEAK